MHNVRNALVAGGSAALLCLSLVACGGVGAGGTANDAQGSEEIVTYDPNVQPDLIYPGWLDGDRTSDLWWPNGEVGSGEAVYFTRANNDAGINATFVTEENGEESIWNLVVEDDHLITDPSVGKSRRQVDFTFQDNFQCYDAVTETVYVRGDRSQEDYDALLAGLVFIQDPENPSDVVVSFGPDGTVTQKLSGNDPLEGTYQVVSTNVVRCHYDSDAGTWDSDYRFELGSDDSIKELDSGGLKPLQRYDGPASALEEPEAEEEEEGTYYGW